MVKTFETTIIVSILKNCDDDEICEILRAALKDRSIGYEWIEVNGVETNSEILAVIKKILS